MKNTYYFQHDCNARNDERCASLRARHGAIGYGIYWMLIEAMHESTDGKLREDLLDGFCMVNGLNYEELKQVLSTCLDIGLFATNSGFILSHRVVAQKKDLESLLKKRRQAGRIGGLSKAKNESLASAKQVPSKPLPKERKGKERKEKEMKEKEMKLPTGDSEVISSKATDTDRKLSSLLSSCLRKTNLAFQQKFTTDDKLSPRLDKWSEDFEKMRRIDNATEEQIAFVIRWIFESEGKDALFWRPNIQSASKLREKFATLVGVIKRQSDSSRANQVVKV